MRTLALWLVLVGPLLVPSAFAGDPAVRWTVEDYLAIWRPLLATPEGAPLPRLTDPVMAPWADDKAAVALMARANAGDGFALADAARLAAGRYEAHLGDGYAPEYVETTQALLALTTARLYLEVRILSVPAEFLPSHPEIIRDLAPSRARVPQVIRGLMAQAEQAPTVVEPSLVLRALAPLAPTFSRLLLPEEREAFRGQAQRLVRLGGDPAAAAMLRKELRRVAPTSSLVAPFLEMHRAETALYAASDAGLPPSGVAPISLAAEAGGVRYATPDGSLSAVFPFPPSASVWTASDPGEIWTAAVSLSADGPEGTRSASCKTQATPIEDPSEVLARELTGFATRTRVEAAGLAGLEGERVNEGIRIMVRAVVAGDQMCEFKAMGRDTPGAAWQRAFLDSARIQPPAAP